MKNFKNLMLKEEKEYFLINPGVFIIVILIRILFKESLSAEMGISLFIGFLAALFGSFTVLHGILFLLIKKNLWPRQMK